MEITLKDIAQKTGFSINTVSRAVNGKRGVNAVTRERIRQCAAELGYFPNMMAKGIRGGSNGLIGALVSNMADNFFVSLLAGIEEEASNQNMSILIQNAEENAERQLNGLRTLLSYGCKDIIVSPVYECEEVMKLLESSGANYVIADRVFGTMKNCRRVSINNRGDSERIIDYMIRCGHKKIAIVNQNSEIETETGRTDGYRAALKRNDIEPRADYELFVGDEMDIRRKVNVLMRSADRPTALFIAKDTLSLATIMTLLDAGVRIPEDISVFIYGDPDWASALRPSIHGMARPVREVGRIAVQMLLENPESKHELILDSNFIIRNSVRIL